jgi:cellulose/xylan binding protein with CBM9 domain
VATFSGRSNSATAYLQWDDSNLYVAFKVTDPQLNATRTARDAAGIYLDDSVEIYVDTAYDRASTMQPDDYQFIVNLNNAQGDLRGTGAGKDAGWNAIWQSAVRLQGALNANADTDTGYTVEIAIPWAQIGVIPVSGMVLGIELAVNDSAPGSTPSSDYFDWAGIAPNSYAQPALWKRVRLE